MGLTGRIASWLMSKAVEEREATGAFQIQPFMHNRPYIPLKDPRSLIEKYIGWVYACANKNAQSAAQVPLRLFTTKQVSNGRKVSHKHCEYLSKSPSVGHFVRKASEIQEIPDHPFLDIMRAVNPVMNQFDLMELTYISLEITGNAYWFIVRDDIFREPEVIWPLLPQFVKPVMDKDKRIQFWIHSLTGALRPDDQGVVRIEPEDMIHFKYQGLKDYVLGQGPLEAAVMSADLSTNYDVHETSLLRNSAVPETVLILPPEQGEPGTEEKKRMKTEWHQTYGGPRKKGKLGILHGGAELKQVALNPKDMNFLKGRDATLEQIAGIFGVPLSKLTTKNVNLANASAGEKMYQKDTIRPKLRRAEQKMNEQLLPNFGDNLFVAYDDPVPEDVELRNATIESHLKTGYSVINEERAEDNKEPVEWGDIPLVPQQLAPLGSQPIEVTPFEEPKAVKKAARKFPPLEHPTNFINPPLVRAVQRWYQDRENEILADFDKDIDDILAGQKAQKDPIADDFMAGWFDMQEWNTALAAKIEPITRATFQAGGQRALRSLTEEFQFDPISRNATDAFELHRQGSLVRITNTTAGEIRAAVSTGMEAGEGAKTIRKRLTDKFAFLAKNRAELIARTETIWAWNEGAVNGYAQSGLVERKVWVSSADDRTCQWCPEMDGKTVEVSGNFHEKGGKFLGRDGGVLKFDFEQVNHPPLHPQCRCTVAPVVE